MANYRQIHTKIWKDSWFLDLEPEFKLLFIYLFSNERACLTGLYDISQKVIAFECGLTSEQVKAGLDHFELEGKAFYADGWLWVPNLVRYNAGNISSIHVRKHIDKLIKDTPNVRLKQHWIRYFNDEIAPQYGIDTVSDGMHTARLHEHEHEQEQEHEGFQLSDFFRDAMHTFEGTIGLVSGAGQAEDIRVMLDELEQRGLVSWWQTAIEIAADQNKRSWAYVRGILNNCLETGVAPVRRVVGKPHKSVKRLLKVVDPDTGEPVEVEAMT